MGGSPIDRGYASLSGGSRRRRIRGFVRAGFRKKAVSLKEAMHMLDRILDRIPGTSVFFRMLSIALLGSVVVSMVACAPVKRRTFDDSSTEYSYHTVMYPGETLSLIARWYTGQSGNWEIILDHNGNLDPRRLRLGDLVKIPQELLVRDDSMPKAFVEKANAKIGAKAPAKGAETATSAESGAAKKVEPVGNSVEAAQAVVERGNADADAAAAKSEARTKTRDELLQELLQDQ